MKTDEGIIGARLELTNRCNLTCPDCYCNVFAASNCKDLPTEKWRAIISQLAAAGVKRAKLIGGEIFLRHDLPVLLGALESHRIESFAITNGTLLSPRVIEMLHHFASLKMVSISLDGVDEQTNARVRPGFSGLDNIREVIGQLSSFLTVSISTTVRPDNIDSVEKLIQEAGKWGVEYIHLQPLMRFFPEEVEASAKLLRVESLGLSVTTCSSLFSDREIHAICQVLFRSRNESSSGKARVTISPSLGKDLMERTLRRQLVGSANLGCTYLDQYAVDHGGHLLLCPFIRTILDTGCWWQGSNLATMRVTQYKNILRKRLLPICNGCCGLTLLNTE